MMIIFKLIAEKTMGIIVVVIIIEDLKKIQQSKKIGI